MGENLVSFLKKSKIFSSVELEDNVYEALLTKFEDIQLAKEDILFHEDEHSHFLYILVSGKLSANMIIPHSKKMRTVGYILPGETVGESGALSNDRRTFTVKAEEDSRLLKLPTVTFKKLCRQFPGILLNTIEPLASRSQHIIRILASGEKKHIAIIPANEDVNFPVFANKIKNTLRNYKKIAMLSDWDIHSEQNQSPEIDKFITEIEENNHIILYLLKAHDTPLAQHCLNKAGKIYIVADGNQKPYLSEFTLNILNDTHNLVEIRRELVLIYKLNTIPSKTSEWLSISNFFIHHNIKENSHADYQRLLRFMRGKAQGLVFGGGGVKGWAEIGALKAILEAGISIDAVGGTSVGAMVAALYAMYENYDSIFYQFSRLIDATRNTVSFKKLSWPAVSLFSCKEFTIELSNVFNAKNIEDLWLPYFCISTNLGSYKEMVHRHGSLWEKIRGSASIPGIVPPMVLNGELHVDGGLVNNLPVNTMREILGAESKIIAVELNSSSGDPKHYNFPPTLTFKQAFLSKLRLSYREYKFPSFIDTFLKSLLVGSSMKQEENASLADLLISLQTQRFSMLNLREKAQERLFNMGYQTALEKIAECDLK